MKFKVLMFVIAVSCTIGCSSSEPSSVADGLSQQQLDDYNALVEEEARRSAEAGNIGRDE